MTPAQLIRTSMAPWSPSTAARWTLPTSVTSISTSLSLPSMSGIRRWSGCAESGFRQPGRTRQPSTAYCRANSSPMPRFAPVTSTVFIAAAPPGYRSRIRLSIRRRSGEALATLSELETSGRRERLRSFRAPALIIVSPERGIAPVGDLRRSSVQYTPAVHGGPMSVEPTETMSEAWAKWEGRLIGAFPLRRYLGSSDHSGVFLTEIEGREPSQVALKVVPALATLVESQLSSWNDVANLSHPHLVRLLGTGRFQLDGLTHEFSPTLREIVARCLQLRPEDRPRVPELDAWIRGKSPGPAPVQPARAAARPQPSTPTPMPELSAAVPQPSPQHSPPPAPAA